MMSLFQFNALHHDDQLMTIERLLFLVTTRPSTLIKFCQEVSVVTFVCDLS
jgi:hypothetical protein